MQEPESHGGDRAASSSTNIIFETPGFDAFEASGLHFNYNSGEIGIDTLEGRTEAESSSLAGHAPPDTESQVAQTSHTSILTDSAPWLTPDQAFLQDICSMQPAVTQRSSLISQQNVGQALLKQSNARCKQMSNKLWQISSEVENALCVAGLALDTEQTYTSSPLAEDPRRLIESLEIYRRCLVHVSKLAQQSIGTS